MARDIDHLDIIHGRIEHVKAAEKPDHHVPLRTCQGLSMSVTRPLATPFGIPSLAICTRSILPAKAQMLPRPTYRSISAFSNMGYTVKNLRLACAGMLGWVTSWSDPAVPPTNVAELPPSSDGRLTRGWSRRSGIPFLCRLPHRLNLITTNVFTKLDLQERGSGRVLECQIQ